MIFQNKSKLWEFILLWSWLFLDQASIQQSYTGSISLYPVQQKPSSRATLCNPLSLILPILISCMQSAFRLLLSTFSLSNDYVLSLFCFYRVASPSYKSISKFQCNLKLTAPSLNQRMFVIIYDKFSDSFSFSRVNEPDYLQDLLIFIKHLTSINSNLGLLWSLLKVEESVQCQIFNNFWWNRLRKDNFQQLSATFQSFLIFLI